MKKRKKNSKNKRMQKLNGFCAAFTALCVLVIFFWKVEFFVVHGNSMEPSFKDGSFCFYIKEDLSYKKGDVVVFTVKRGAEHEKFIKRVIATAGDEVYTRHGHLIINGERIPGRFFEERIEHVIVPAGHVYVLGDNLDDSCDSRELGFIREKDVCGVAYRLL